MLIHMAFTYFSHFVLKDKVGPFKFNATQERHFFISTFFFAFIAKSGITSQGQFSFVLVAAINQF